MKWVSFNWVLIILVLLLSGSCSLQKNNAGTRAYHQLTSQYNIYFNAKESVKAGLLRIDKTFNEDYTHLLPLFPASNPAAAQVASSEMEYAVQKCLKLMTLHSINKPPKRTSNNSEKYIAFASKGEYNKWVDDAYFLMGQANYYLHDYHRSQENFNYVLRNFTNQPTRYPAFIWLARTYLETGEFEKATEIYKLLERDGNLAVQIKKELALGKANFLILQKKWPEAIDQLRQVLTYRLNRKERGRYNFIIAQLFAQLNQRQEAIAAYNQVVKTHPPYKMAFQAKIAALELSDATPEELTKALDKMIRSSSNRPYLDRLYYAKGQIALKNNQKEEALKDFTSSVLHSFENNSQRAMSSLTAARLYFEESKYRLSSCYFDSALAVIDSYYPGYDSIVTKSNGLTALVKNLDITKREDSLQKVALMSKEDRLAYINKLIAKVNEAEALAEKEKQSETSDQNYFRNQQYRQPFATPETSSMWYFYNPVTAGLGKSDFQRIWGKRKLEDNWRRKNKMAVNPLDSEEEVQVEGLVKKEKPKESNPKAVEYYLQDLPLTDSLMQVSNDKIKGAIFATGRIYADALKDEPHAVEAFEELNRRYPGSIYELSAWIELYKMHYETELYRGKIISGYPESNYARYLQNPDFFKELETSRHAVEQKYGEALQLYTKGDFAGAGRLSDEINTLRPDSAIMAKTAYMSLIANGIKVEKPEFVKLIDQYLAKFPASSVKPITLKIRELVQQNSVAELEKKILAIDSTTYQNQQKAQNIRKDELFAGKYTFEEELFHYFVIAYPKNSKVDINRLIFDIANFNIDYYTSSDFDIEEINLNEQTKLVVVRSLANKEEGLSYFGTIIRQKNVFRTLKEVECRTFIASSTNYRKIIADQDYMDYLKFFILNYSRNITPTAK